MGRWILKLVQKTPVSRKLPEHDLYQQKGRQKALAKSWDAVAAYS